MKNKRKLRTILVTSGLALISSALFLVPFKDTKLAEAASIINVEPTHESTDWYTLDVDPTSGHDNPIDDYKFNVLFSPQPADYKTINKNSVNSLLNGLMNGLKNIVTSQIKFIMPVANPERKENEDWSLKPTEEIRPSVLDALISGVLRDSKNDDQPIQENVDDFDATIVDGDLGLEGSSGVFLRSMVSYMAAYGQLGETDVDLIPSRLGVSVDQDGKVTPLPQSTTFQEFLSIYNELGDPNAEEKALLDLQTLYDDAKGIATDSTLQTEALVKILDGLEETAVPVKTVINILGPENVLNGVMDVFTDHNVSIQYSKHFLNDLDQRTVADICDIIQLELYDPNTGEGGFTKQDILDAFDEAGNERLMEIFDGLTPNGLNNIRLILGKPVDYADGGFVPADPEPVTTIKAAPIRKMLGSSGSEQASMDDYGEFGSKLMEIIMERLSINDLLAGVRSLKVHYKGIEYMILEKPVVDGVVSDNLQLKVHNIVDLLNALPKMEEIRDLPDEEQKIDFSVDLITVINDRTIEYDEVTHEVISDEMVPITFNFTVGFQEKDCSYVRKLAGILDDTFDLTFDFEEDGEFWINLVTRNPKFVSNIYGWLCDSGFIKNDDDRKFLNEVWDMAFSSIKDIKAYIQNKEVEDIVADLKEIDYETAINTLTSAEELNEIFNVSGFTEERLERAVELFAKAVHKGATISYDEIVQIVRNALGNLANKLDNETLRGIYEKLQQLLIKLDGKNISLEMLRGITNDSVYEYVNKITGKSDIVLKIRDAVVKAINALPDEAQELSVMDYYKGNGEFKGSITLDDIPYETAIKRVGGDKAWVTFEGLVSEEERPTKFSFSFDSYFDDLYSIEYEWVEDGVDKSKKGMLHTGSDVMLFGGLDEDDNGQIVHWLDKAETFKRVDEMVDYDIVVIPENVYQVEISDDIEKVYDGTGSLFVSVTATYLDQYEFSYQWQKYDADEDDWVNVGEDSDTISVPNVLDSGKYRCVLDNDDIKVTSPTATVTITPAPVDVTPTEWVDEGPFLYTGSPRSVEIDESTIPTGATLSSYSQEYSETEIGEYTAQANFSLIDEDNYYFVDDIDYITLDWEISDNAIEFDAEWLTDYEFEYDGEEHHCLIDPDTYPADKVTVSYETKLVTEEDTSYLAGGKVEIGEYVTKAVFTSIDPNFVISEGSTPSPKEFYIYREVDLSALTWSHHDEFTYDTNEHSVYVLNSDTIPEIKSITYETGDSNKQTDVGEYETIATINYNEELGFNEHTIHFINDNVSGVDNAKEWSIIQASIKVDHVEWDYSEPFTYSPSESYTVDLIDGCLPEQVGYRFVDDQTNTAQNAGTYTATVEIFIKPEYEGNYKLSSDSALTYSLTWKINPKVINLSSVVWSDETTPLTYNGEEQSTSIVSASNLTKADITYDNETNTDAGTYMVTAYYTSNDPNYVFVDSSVSHMYVINKKKISVTDIVWTSEKEVTYDGESHTIEVISYEDDELIDVSYSTEKGGVNAGSYTVVANFALNSEAEANYILIGNKSSSETLLINPKHVSSSDIITWNTTVGDDYVYDAESHMVYAELTGEDADAFEFGYIHNDSKTHEATEAGQYTAQIVCTVKASQSGNYVIDDTTNFSYDWEITKKVVTISDVVWGNDTFTFDGNEHSITATYVVSDGLTDLVDVSYVGNAEINANTTANPEYVAEVSFTLKDTDNYEFAEDYTTTHAWKINPKHISVGTVIWSNGEFTYNTEEHSVSVLSYENMDVVEITSYSGESATNAGNYTAVATFSVSEAMKDNYVLDVSEATFDYVIHKAIISVSNVVWSDGNLVYNGEEQGITLTYNDSDLINVTIMDNKATNADYYVAKAFFEVADPSNYVLDGVDYLEQNWLIAKKGISASEAVWTDELTPFVYNGETQTTVIESFEDADLVTIKYVGNTGENAGNYEAIAVLTLLDEYTQNYYLVDGYVVHEYEIAKKQISVDDVVWNYNPTNPYVYTKGEQEVDVVSFENSEFIDFEYVNDEEFTNKGTEIGDYIAKVEFEIKVEYADNYELVGDDTAILNWKIIKGEVIIYNTFSSVETDGDNQSYAIVHIEEGIEENPELYAELTNGDAFANVTIDYKELIGADGEVKYAYEIFFMNEGEEYVIGDNEYTIMIMIPEDIRDGEFVIVILNEDSTVTKVETELDESGKYAIISGDFVKNIGFITKLPPSTALSDNLQVITLLIIVVAGQAAFAVGTVVVARKLRKYRETHDEK